MDQRQVVHHSTNPCHEPFGFAHLPNAALVHAGTHRQKWIKVKIDIGGRIAHAQLVHGGIGIISATKE
jgi:hypothetical protein